MWGKGSKITSVSTQKDNTKFSIFVKKDYKPDKFCTHNRISSSDEAPCLGSYRIKLVIIIRKCPGVSANTPSSGVESNGVSGLLLSIASTSYSTVTSSSKVRRWGADNLSKKSLHGPDNCFLQTPKVWRTSR